MVLNGTSLIEVFHSKRCFVHQPHELEYVQFKWNRFNYSSFELVRLTSLPVIVLQLQFQLGTLELCGKLNKKECGKAKKCCRDIIGKQIITNSVVL